MTVEAVLILLLIKVRIFRTLPGFFVYLCWSLFSDLSMLSLRNLSSGAFFRAYEIQMVVDSAMIFAVLVELTWSVLIPIRSSLPKRSWIGVVLLIGVAGCILWPVAGFAVPAYLSPAGSDFFRLQQTFAILRVVVFLALAAFSQLLSIGWRNRELQVATGLGFYSLVSLAVSVMHTHQTVSLRGYHWLDEVIAASYLGSLTYWVVAFATKAAERQDFSPQMENFLLLIGGTAKAARVALGEITVTRSRYKDHR